MTNQLPPLKSEAFALRCLQKYADQGLVVGPENGEFAHTPVPACLGGTAGVWLLHDDHMAQGLLQADDYGTTTFHHGDTAAWLSSSNPPQQFLDLWEKWRLHHNQVQVHWSWSLVVTTRPVKPGYLEEQSQKVADTTFQNVVWVFSPPTPETKVRRGVSRGGCRW